LLKDGEIFAAEKNQTLWRPCNKNRGLPAKIRNRAA
jgi:hypothetical protein